MFGNVKQPANTASVSLEERREASPVSPFGSNNEEDEEEAEAEAEAEAQQETKANETE